jgi:hypothetical protein
MVNSCVTDIQYATGVFGYMTHLTGGLSAEGRM